MLDQASVQQVKEGVFPRDVSHIVITMRFYPRFLKKQLRDEFICDLAPVKELLHDFNSAQKRLGDHNSAFKEIDYENRFQLSESGYAHLKRLSNLSIRKNVYLTCLCRAGEKCHREMLLLISKELFGAKIGAIFHSYPDIVRRMDEFRR